MINLARWTRGAIVYLGDLSAYRVYVVNHEVGHALGEKHRPCPAPGAPAPVMMQQTYGTDNAYVQPARPGRPCQPRRRPRHPHHLPAQPLARAVPTHLTLGRGPLPAVASSMPECAVRRRRR